MSVFYSLRSAGGVRFVADLPPSEQDEWRSSFPSRLLHDPLLSKRWIPFEGQISSGCGPGEVLPDIVQLPVTANSLVGVSRALMARTENLWGLFEAFELRCRDAEYVAVRARTAAGLVDQEASTFTITPDKGWKFHVLHLDTQGIRDRDAFHVPEADYLFCSGGFIEGLTDAQASGWMSTQVFPPTAAQLANEVKLRNEAQASPLTFGDPSRRM